MHASVKMFFIRVVGDIVLCWTGLGHSYSKDSTRRAWRVVGPGGSTCIGPIRWRTFEENSCVGGCRRNTSLERFGTLGYSHDDRRIELSSPQIEFTWQIQTQDQSEPGSEAGMTSYESWKAWLAIFSLGGRKTILSQETVEPAQMSALKP